MYGRREKGSNFHVKHKQAKAGFILTKCYTQMKVMQSWKTMDIDQNTYICNMLLLESITVQ